MSLTTIIAYKGEFGLEFREVLEAVRPKAVHFKTQGGLPAFSSDYRTLAPYRLNSYQDAALVGIAFDYLARFIVAKYSQIPLDNSAFYFYNAFLYIHDPEKKLIIERMKDHFHLIDEFYQKPEISDKFLAHLFTLAKLEQIARRGDFNEEDLSLVLQKTSFAIVEDIRKLGRLFKRVFIDNKLIKSSSFVIYNPTYSNTVTKALRGIDADMYFDGVLIDLKSTKNFSYDMDDAYQLIGYYLFHLIDKALNANTELSLEQVEKLAFYKARAGQIEYFNVQSMDKHAVYEALLKLIAMFKIKVSEQKLIEVVADMY